MSELIGRRPVDPVVPPNAAAMVMDAFPPRAGKRTMRFCLPLRAPVRSVSKKRRIKRFSGFHGGRMPSEEAAKTKRAAGKYVYNRNGRDFRFQTAV